VKILKLCTSDELAPGIPEGQRAYQVAERVIHDATGEAVETTLRVIWPSPQLPDLLDQWLDKYGPDLVLFVVSPFWMTFESTPLKLQRRFGKAGQKLGQMGARVGGHPKVSETRAAMAARRLLISTIGGDFYFEPEEISELTDACTRRVLARESVGLVIRAPLTATGLHGNESSMRRASERRQRTARLLRELCEQVHVTFVDRHPSMTDEADRFEARADLVHSDVRAHRRRGELEGAALVEAWRQLSGSEPGQ
jgi:hypothetical protein